MSCNICVNTFNKSTRRVVRCNYCAFESCRECNKHYILGSVNEPHCMNCKVPWNDDFITACFTKVFFNKDLATHRANVLFEREKTLMPQSQETIRVMHLEQEIAGLHEMVKVYEKIKRQDEVKRYRDKIAQLVAEHPDAGDGDAGPSTSTSGKRKAPRPVCGCIKDECRGFVMSNTWKCGVCSTKVCHQCLKEDTGSTHECNEDDKNTRKLLLENTKPCPKCGVMINKLSGCSQMWCVMCHTTFKWDTCEIVTGGIHNPHYFEWLRRNGNEHEPTEEPVRMPCEGDLVRIHVVTPILNARYSKDIVSILLNMYRAINHINDVMRQALQTDTNAEFGSLRVKYLLQDITEAEYRHELVKIDRRAERKRTEWQIAEVFAIQAYETIEVIYRTKPLTDRVKTLIEDMSKLATYCNEQFRMVAKRYNASSAYNIRPNFSYVWKERF